MGGGLGSEKENTEGFYVVLEIFVKIIKSESRERIIFLFQCINKKKTCLRQGWKPRCRWCCG